MSSTDHTTSPTHDDPPSVLPHFLFLALLAFVVLATLVALIATRA